MLKIFTASLSPSLEAEGEWPGFLKSQVAQAEPSWLWLFAFGSWRKSVQRQWGQSLPSGFLSQGVALDKFPGSNSSNPRRCISQSETVSEWILQDLLALGSQSWLGLDYGTWVLKSPFLFLPSIEARPKTTALTPVAWRLQCRHRWIQPPVCAICLCWQSCCCQSDKDGGKPAAMLPLCLPTRGGLLRPPSWGRGSSAILSFSLLLAISEISAVL